MPKRAHLVAGLLALSCVATIFLSTVLTELFGSPAAVAQLKLWIVAPGLWILVPAMAAAGVSGLFLSQPRRVRRAQADLLVQAQRAAQRSPSPEALPSA